MAVYFQNQQEDYDGSPSGLNNIITATGQTVITFAGSEGISNRAPTIDIYTNNETGAKFVRSLTLEGDDSFVANFTAGTNWYVVLTKATPDFPVDLTYS